MLDTRHIRLITAVAEHGSLVRAGRVLGMSPSALTRALMAVEERLGASLFDRSRRGLEPTSVCRAVLAKATALLRAAEELDAVLHDLRGEQGQTLSVAAGPASLDTVVPGAAARFVARAAGVQLQLEGGSAADAVRALLDRRAALAIAEVSDLPSAKELEVTPLRRHPLLLLARAGHPIFGLGRPPAAADVFRHPLITPGFLAARLNLFLAEGLRAAGRDRAQAFPAIVSNSLPNALAIAARSDAVAGCTAPAALPRLATGELAVIPWRPGWLETNFGILRLRARRASPAENLFVECLQEADRDAFEAARTALSPALGEPSEVLSAVGTRTAPALPTEA